jgi:hypothetical protein
MPEQHRPGVGMMRLAWTGFAFLLIFCLIWLGWRIF